MLIDGVLQSPHFTFFRCAGVCSEAMLLRLLGLEEYHRVAGDVAPTGRPHLFLAQDAAWVQLADDYFYTLWHSAAFRERVREVARGCPVFSFWVGESDCSYGFSAWQDGELVRRRVVESPERHVMVTAEDAGAALPGETHVLAGWDEASEAAFPVLCALARAQGIDLSHEGRPISCYAWSSPGGQSRPMRRA